MGLAILGGVPLALLASLIGLRNPAERKAALGGLLLSMLALLYFWLPFFYRSC
ncbi:MAG TPA: hypothetical protein VGP72_17695 [Planctomycetota bacterium]